MCVVSGYETHYTCHRRTERKLHSPEITHSVSVRPSGITQRLHHNDRSLNADRSKPHTVHINTPCGENVQGKFRFLELAQG